MIVNEFITLESKARFSCGARTPGPECASGSGVDVQLPDFGLVLGLGGLAGAAGAHLEKCAESLKIANLLHLDFGISVNVMSRLIQQHFADVCKNFARNNLDRYRQKALIISFQAHTCPTGWRRLPRNAACRNFEKLHNYCRRRCDKGNKCCTSPLQYVIFKFFRYFLLQVFLGNFSSTAEVKNCDLYYSKLQKRIIIVPALQTKAKSFREQKNQRRNFS